jgi:hypothetical protein
VNAALYGTIWISLFLFALGEAGKRGLHDGRAPRLWAWPVSACGCAIAIVHIGIAMGAVHGWSHSAAVAATARQTSAVFGLNFGGGVYFNYAFVLLWAIEVWIWRRSPERYTVRSPVVTWLLRAFYLVIIANAAIVFAGAWRRAAGGLVVASLIASWWPSFDCKPGPRRGES